MGFAYAFGGFERFSILVFSDSPLCVCFFSDFEGGGENWSESQGHQTRDFPMICHDQRFFRSALFPKTTPD